MNKLSRGLVILSGLILVWEAIVLFFQLPPYILPSPWLVAKSLQLNWHLILTESLPTVIETLLGLLLGVIFGCLAALIMAFFRPARMWMLPVLIISQAIPTFAIAPLLVIWFGFGMASKIVTTIMMLFFPITSAFFDGLRRTDPGWLDLAKTLKATKMQIFWRIRIPAALPSLASGLRVATAIAPIGAVVGEWVGASRGVGYLMMNANARMQIDLMFAALISIILFSLILYFSIDKLLRVAIYWQTEG
ncbi:MAG: ABC transporter permease [Gammaproteobacteria bacterium]|nr:ABC transporter permease [Gammaproteobacteria bacterium]